MFDYEAYIKLDNDIKHRPATFQGTTAEWEALSAAEKAYYIDGIVDLSDDSLDPEVVDQYPTENSTNLVQSGGIYKNIIDLAHSMVDKLELSNIAIYPHEVNSLFIRFVNNNLYYFRTTAAIASGDTIQSGVNCTQAEVANEILRRDKARKIQDVSYTNVKVNQWEACATFQLQSLKRYGIVTTWYDGRPYSIGIGNSPNLTAPNMYTFADDQNDSKHIADMIFPVCLADSMEITIYVKRAGAGQNYYRLYEL